MLLFDIIGWLVIGFIVGLLARFLVPGRDPMGCLATSLIGIIGAFVGGFISHIVRSPGHEFNLRPMLLPPNGHYVRPGFLWSLLGAIIVVIVVRAVRRR